MKTDLRSHDRTVFANLASSIAVGSFTLITVVIIGLDDAQKILLQAERNMDTCKNAVTETGNSIKVSS